MHKPAMHTSTSYSIWPTRASTMGRLTDALESFSPLIDRIYSCGLQQKCWESVLQELAGIFAADNANLLTPRNFDSEDSLWISHGIEFGVWLDYVRYYHRHDVLAQAGQAQGIYVTGNAVTDTAVLDKRSLLRSEFYNDYWRPQGVHHAIASVVSDGCTPDDEMPLVVLGLYRQPRRAPFSAAETRLVQLLNPHLHRALRTAMQLQRMHLHSVTAQAMLASSMRAYGICTGNGRLLYANPPFERLLQDADGLVQRNGCLSAASSGVQQMLSRILMVCTSSPSLTQIPESKAIAIARPSGKPAYSLHVQRLPYTEMRLGAPAKILALVQIHDPAANKRRIQECLQHTYGLTSAECRLALSLATGSSVQQAAEAFGVTLNTARSQLKAILAKTDTHRQTELLLLLNRLAKD